MVFLDINSNFTSDKKQEHVANVFDRFFSFVLDYILISPFIIFAITIIFQHPVNKFWSEIDQSEKIKFNIILASAYVLLFSLVQSLFAAKYKATPGQFFLKLKLQPISVNEQDLFFKFFQRNVLFWVSFLFLGIPFLGLLSNKDGQTFYDRLARTYVSTNKKDTPIFGFELEHRFWSSLQKTFTLFFVLLLALVAHSQLSSIKNKDLAFEHKKSEFCSGLEAVAVSERLSTAIALKLMDQFSADCLAKEADFVLWNKLSEKQDLAYYAKSLTDEDKSKNNKYLMKACQGKTSGLGCVLATYELTKQKKMLQKDLNNTGLLSLVVKYNVSDEQDKPQALEKIAKFNHIKAVKKFEISELLKSKDSKERAPAAVEDSKIEKVMELLKDL